MSTRSPSLDPTSAFSDSSTPGQARAEQRLKNCHPCAQAGLPVFILGKELKMANKEQGKSKDKDKKKKKKEKEPKK